MASFKEMANANVSQFIFDNLLQVIACAILLFLTQRWLKRKYFQNLPPGPVGLPIVGYLPFLGAEPHKTLLELSKKYGSDIIGLYLGSKYTVVLNNYSLLREAYSHTASLDRAPDLFRNIPEMGFSTLNGKEWQEQRRFSMSVMRNLGLGKSAWESSIREEVQSLVKEIVSSRGEPVDISHKLNNSIIANIVALLIGRKLEKGSDDDKIQTSADFSELSLTYTGPSDIASLVPRSRAVLEYFRISGYYRSAKAVADFFSFLKNEILSHKVLEEKKDSKDYIDLYMIEMMKQKTSQHENHSFTENNMLGNLTSLFIGGTDTIFTSLIWLFRFMAEHKEVQSKVHKELDETIGSEGTVSYETRHRIPYISSVLLESQRYSSIARLGATRRANAAFEIGGYAIPKGAEILPNLWAVHHDPSLWENPEEFRPERFLTDDKASFATNLPGFVAFSLGKRGCPGEAIAYREMLAYFTAVMQKFTVTSAQGAKPNFETGPGLVSHLNPQPLCFIDRT